MVRLSGSEAGVIVGFPTRWLSSNGGQSEKFWVFLRCGCWYIIHGEYWHSSFQAFTYFWRVSMCSCHDLEKNSTQGVEFKYTVRDMPNRHDNSHQRRSTECMGFGEAISNITLELKP